MTGLEVGAGLLGKFSFGKAVTWAGAHALAGSSSATLNTLSLHAGANILAGAAGASSTLGAVGALAGGASVYQGYAFAVQSRKEKNAQIASKKPGALGDVPGPLKNELVARVFVILEDVYRKLQIKGQDGVPENA